MGRIRWIPAGAGAAAAALALAACAGLADDELTEPREPVAATPAAFTGAIDAAGGEPYRYSLSIEVGDGADDPDAGEVLHATGEVDGDMVRVHADLSAHVAERDIPDGLTTDDLFVETIAGPDILYARSPLAAADRPPPDLTPDDLVEITDALADGWVTIDVGGLSVGDGDRVEPVQVACLLLGVGADPGDLLDIARQVTSVERVGGDDPDSDDEADGADEIDGVQVDVLAGDVPLPVVLGAGRPDDLPGADLGPLADLTVPVEVWVDADGVARRVRLTRDLGEVTDALIDAGELPPAAAAGAQPVITYTADLSDHGDGTIDVAAPDEASDITEPVQQFLDRLGRVPTGLGSMADSLAELEALYDELADLDAELPDLGDLPEMEEYPTFEELYPEYADGPPAPEDFDPGPIEPPPPPETYAPPDMDELEQEIADLNEEIAELDDWEAPELPPPPPEPIDPGYTTPGG